MDRTENGSEFQTALLEPRRQQSNRLKILKLHDFQPRILYPAKQFKCKGTIKSSKIHLLCTPPQKHLLKDKIYQNKRMNQNTENKVNSQSNTGRRMKDSG